jgi:hypothetical protein
MANITNLAQNSYQYVQSLIDYVLDVKPYHTKLTATGAISEEYLFSDSLTVSIAENQTTEFIVGADLLNIAIPGANRSRISQTWWHNIISNGSTSTWAMPQIDEPLFASEENLASFTVGINDYTGIVGLPTGAFDPKRFDGPGVTLVTRNGIQQQDTVDYTLSNGIFSFDVLSGGNWIEHDLKPVTRFNHQSGALLYDNVIRKGGTIGGIANGNYEEWTITTTAVSGSTAEASVVGSVSGNIGTATFGQTFTASQLSFFWGPAPGQTGITTVLGDVWVLTPSSKVVVLPTAPQETWSIIWSNPIALSSPPIFTPAVARNDSPAIEIHTRSLELTSEEVSWSIVFNGNGTYTLDRTALTNPNNISYPITVDLVNGCSFKNADIAFTILPTATGWNAGDAFSWTVGPSVSNFKVYGSVSGWQANAKIGEWYWNGIIGFKIPALDYFVLDSTVNFIPISAPTSMVKPSVYQITFTTATNGTTPGLATVYNNVYGYRDGLTQGQPWSDEYVAFQIDSSNLTQYKVGDTINVYIANSATFYSQASNSNLIVGDDYCAQLYPFYHSNGVLVWHLSAGTGTSLKTGDQIVIDKAYYTPIKLSIAGANGNYPELGATTDDWVPLRLKYFDNVNPTTTNGLYTPTSVAEFSDLATYIQAYSAADPSKLVFSVMSPRYLKTDRVASSQLTFDPTFFSTYLPFGAYYSLRYEPDGVYGQKINVSIIDNLQIAERAYFSFAEGPNAPTPLTGGYYLYQYNFNGAPPAFQLLQQVADALPSLTNPSSYVVSDSYNISTTDSGAVDITSSSIGDGLTIVEITGSGYDIDPYDTTPYDFDSTTVIEYPIIALSGGTSSQSTTFTVIPATYAGGVQYSISNAFSGSTAVGSISGGNNSLFGTPLLFDTIVSYPRFALVLNGSSTAPIETIFDTVTVTSDSGNVSLTASAAAPNYTTNGTQAYWEWSTAVNWTSGNTYSITLTSSSGSGSSNTVSIAGNLTNIFPIGQIITTAISAAGASYTDGTYINVPLTGGSGSGAEATVTVLAGSAISVTVTTPGQNYVVGDTLSFSAASVGGTGSGGTISVLGVYNEQFQITNSANNNGTYTVTAATFDGTNTVLTIAETLPSTTVDGDVLPLQSEWDYAGIRMSLTFDFAQLEPAGWTQPFTTGFESYGLTVPTTNTTTSSVADSYLVTMINRTSNVYPPYLVIESIANPGVYGYPVVNPSGIPLYPETPDVVSTSAFTFQLPTGFTAPFKLWILDTPPA